MKLGNVFSLNTLFGIGLYAAVIFASFGTESIIIPDAGMKELIGAGGGAGGGPPGKKGDRR